MATYNLAVAALLVAAVFWADANVQVRYRQKMLHDMDETTSDKMNFCFALKNVKPSCFVVAFAVDDILLLLFVPGMI